MNRNSYRRKLIALFFLIIFGVNVFAPATVLALTSGPKQPEMSGFQPAGVSDMVDVFSGDFKYNIPLLDVDGYPVNINYQSGVGMDDEASWVGLGWNLNVGSLNRQLRGLPDDYNGDQIATEQSIKPEITIGGSANLKGELAGFKLGSINGGVTLGLFNNSYTGIGAEYGANAGFNVGLPLNDAKTMSLGISGGVGITSNTSTGVNVNPQMNLGLRYKASENATISAGFSAALGYNTRGGYQSLQLGLSYSESINDNEGKNLSSQSLDLGGSEMFYSTPPFYPKPNMEFNNVSGTFNYNAGGLAWIAYGSTGGTGYFTARTIKRNAISKPGYGFLYSHKGKLKDNALMDFKRELDNPVIPELPNLAIPVHMPDIFSFTSQNGGGQFRLYRGGTGIFFDDRSEERMLKGSGGFDIGAGNIFHGGITIQDVDAKTLSGKWKNNNAYAANGDFQNESTDPKEDPVFFKQVGEKTLANDELENQIFEDAPVAINMDGRSATNQLRKHLVDVNGTVHENTYGTSSIKRTKKMKRRAAISYLTAEEAGKGALNKTITTYQFNNTTSFSPTNRKVVANNSDRVTAYRKPHHISEFTITNEAGQRMVYGTPVYNIKQEEYLFNVGSATGDDDNLVSAPMNQGNTEINVAGKGVDEYSFHQVQPAYATSYMLDAILSPDYVDVTGDGITDDDLGSWVKFNYSKTAQNYGWRSPFNKNGIQANINDGKLADDDDNKGAITYGEKELWYLHSIETKTKIAYFLLGERNDGLGVQDWKGVLNDGVKQKKLEQIRLYSKYDSQKPIKSIVFKYASSGNELCQGVPNRQGSGGKLTLESVRFAFWRNDPESDNVGKDQEYKFKYGSNASYAYVSSDRWGIYKPNTGTIKNDEYPYAEQDLQKANEQAAQWLMNEIQLPTGGTIQVEYEADDYGYVQNKRAMVMMKPEKIITSLSAGAGTNSNDELPGTSQSNAGVQMKLNQRIPDDITTPDQLRRWLLNGDEYIYGKLFVNVTDKPEAYNGGNNNKFDYVSCYARVTSIQIVPNTPERDRVNIMWEPITDNGRSTVTANPFAIAAWQKMRMEYPQYAYPGYESKVKVGDDPGKVFKASLNALLNSIKNLRELQESFYVRANRKNYCKHVYLNKSFFRLVNTSGFKKGGGVRVKKIKMNNNWEAMSGNIDNASYGMAYDYTTKDQDGTPISSGVAAYEPLLGNDENPLRQPVPYLQSIKGALNSLFYLEQPFGENYFPAPSVGYNKITVRNLNENGIPDPNNQMGWTVSEFYTAKEFPATVKATSMQNHPNGPNGRSNLFGGFMVHELALSQGYAIYLNDMHGKPKSDAVYDKAGAVITSSQYVYHAEETDAGAFRLKNKVAVIEKNGIVNRNAVLGREIEFFADMRESEYSSYGRNSNFGADVFNPPWGFPPPILVIPHWPAKVNDEYKLFRSASTIKVVQQFGLIQKVIKKQNGSTIEAENMAYDGETGEVVVTRTHNEFKQNLYSVAIPAYWIPEYKSMTGAYQTLGSYLQGFTTDANGIINYSYPGFLQPGDELLDFSAANGRKIWVAETIATGQQSQTPVLRAIDKDGALVTNFTGRIKIIRSGYRNLFSMAGMSITCLEDPIKNNVLSLTNAELNQLRVLDSKATVYTENWDGVPKSNCKTCPEGYQMVNDRCLLDPTPANNCFESLDLFFSDWGNGFSNPLEKQSKFCPSIVVEDLYTNAAKIYTSYNPENGQGSAANFGINSPLWHNNASNFPNAIRTFMLGNDWYSAWNSLPHYTWVGLNGTINIPNSGIKYLALSSKSPIQIRIDNGFYINLSQANPFDNHTYIHLYPVNLDAGIHSFEIRLRKLPLVTISPKFGINLIDNTEGQIMNAQSQEDLTFRKFNFCQEEACGVRPNTLYTSECSTCETGKFYDCTTGSCVTAIAPTIENFRLNPYTKGFKGNWRPVQSQVFQTNRSYGNNAAPAQQGVNIAKDGHYSNFTPYWSYASGNLTKSTVNSEKWVAASTMTLYDQYGQELENRDALNRYSAAAFSFRGTTASLVASNAMYREVFYESFEDKVLRNITPNPNDCSVKPFSFDTYLANANQNESHSGLYALQLNSNVTINTKMYGPGIFHNPLTSLFNHHYITTNTRGEYEYFPSTSGKYNTGFHPMPNKKYVLSCWIKDGAIANNNKPGINFSGTANWIDGNGLKIKARVEGWKLVEGVFQTGNGTDFTLTIPGNGNWLDDLRIHPYDAQMKTYAYDERTLRLMAELDENNFAAFYEYDQEGILNRVKKETEKGIMTIKETRSTYKKRQ